MTYGHTDVTCNVVSSDITPPGHQQIVYISKEANVILSNWKENQDLVGYEFTQNIIFVCNTNELRCAAKCSFDSQCRSWTYSGSKCIGYNSIFSGLGISVLSGTARYYISHDNKSPPVIHS
jgi:hypothetical protein